MLEITEKALLFRINKSHHYINSHNNLYDKTRGVWRVGEKREKVKYAFCIVDSEIKEVYCIDFWEKATPELYEKNTGLKATKEALVGRWQFCGSIDERLSKKYKGVFVKELFKKGNSNPVMYINI